MHSVDPSGANVPAGQNWQAAPVDCPTKPSSANLPAAQSVQLARPAEGLNEPDKHGTQLCGDSGNVPAHTREA